MKIQDATKQGLILSGNSGTVGDDTYKKLTENCFAVLLKGPEVHDIESTTRDVIQEVYAALLTIAAEFGRNDYSKESVLQYLIDECKYDRNRAEYFADTYDHNKLKLQVVLGNIGTHLPHIVDANWKIDYVVKSSSISQSGGVLFRISLSTEVYDPEKQTNKRESVNFTCNSVELQDLVYKLRDCIKHCKRIASEH